jgi:hypothetical protein
MDLPEDDHAFLRDLVKASRQRTTYVKWTDRDGTARQTALTQTEVTRLASIGQRLGLSTADVLRQAAHIPVKR